VGSSNGLSWQAFTWGSVTARRHFPICITSGTFVPTGTSDRTNFPDESVSVETSGLPDTGVAQLSHDGPVAMGDRSSFGT
jgi:hypothetical protein